ncbi:MAG: DNA-3-methyladenine glycosylase [Pelagibacterales bacterium]|nr:DNA-3-methyladenine glycosylase [Pelagibacterales bacterium]|tara:strand:- start:124 stop:759 length:636 start_codon:yes stop_codon:yes gene_type:complete
MNANIKKTYPNWWNNACEELSQKDKIMKILIKKYSDSKISTIQNPFYSLSRCIVGQQISVQAADAVWNRLRKHFNVYDESCFKKLNPIYLKSFGLSERKSIYLISLSEYMINNNSYSFWKKLKDEDIYSRLIEIKGIGPWSIKMFLMFSLNRNDIFSSEDLGLIKAIGKNYYDGNIPKKKEAEALALKWAPWRTAASWFLWRSIDPELVAY